MSPDPSLTLSSIVLVALVAAPIGLMAGMLPGVGGKTALAVATPVLIGCNPLLATIFLMAMHSVVRIGGALPAMVLGVPGSSADAALIVHGHQLSLSGKSRQAINAAASAGVLGGLVGLAGFVILTGLGGRWLLGWAEHSKVYAYLLAFAIIVATDKKGIVAAGFALALGCMLSLIADPLIDQREISILAIMMGLLVAPELLFPDRHPANDPRISSETSQVDSHRILEVNEQNHTKIEDPEIQDERGGQVLVSEAHTEIHSALPIIPLEVMRHKVLALCAALGGWFVGLVPGIGSTSLSWMALTLLGKAKLEPGGDLRGVIAPIAATSAKDGGSFSTTVLLGIPGSSSMLLLAGAMMTYSGGDLVGLTQQLITDIYGVAFILGLTLVVAAVIAPWSGRQLAKVRALPRTTLRNGTLTLVVVSVWLTLPNVGNIATLILATFLGLLLRHCKLPVVPLMLGLVLGADALSLIVAG